ncbi:Rossmann-like and DUF2520 domain-containing protein [Actinomycetota bacterium]
MDKNQNINITIIGAGRLGTTIAYSIAAKNQEKIKIISISSPTQKSLNRAKKTLKDFSKNILFTQDNIKAAAEANCIFICTPDDLIRTVCMEIFDQKNLKNINNKKKNIFVVHFSGSKPLKDLESAKKTGAHTLSIHPLKSLASIERAIETIKNTEYGITYNTPEEEKLAKTIVEILEGHNIKVQDSKKPLYHAAACVASNYLVTLIDYAVYINEKIGIKPKDSIKGLLALVEGTVNNISETGIKKSLTGPIARGDTGTIKDHMKNFKKHLNDKDTEIYKLMGRKTAGIAKQNGWIDNKVYNELINILKDQAR